MILVMASASAIGGALGQSRLDCRTDSLNTCIRLADPLLESPRYVFPATPDDIDHVCNVLFPRTWSEFVSCIRQYTADCLTSDQRADFQRAVGDSINSVHKMCTNTDYRNDYLRHAECIKERSTAPDFCGPHYNRLVEQVKGSRPASQRDMCCTHSSFKACVLHETKSCTCPTQQDCAQGMSAQGFARAMLDKALGFLLKQCQDYVPTDRDCPNFRPPVVEKQPRFNDEETVTEKYGGGSYFPSGAPGREERREEDYPQGRGEDNLDDWGLSGSREDQLEPVTSNSRDEEEREEDQITEGNFLIPVLNPQEDERTRKPWLPSLDGELHSFDDLFSNSVEPAGLSSAAGVARFPIQSLLFPILLLLLRSL